MIDRTQDPVMCAAEDYRRAGAMFRHWLGARPGDQADLASVNALLRELDFRERVALLAATFQLALDLCGNTEETRARVEEWTLAAAAEEVASC